MANHAYEPSFDQPHPLLQAISAYFFWRFPWNVREVKETSIGFFRLVRIEFLEPGSFGRKATFIASRSRWRLFKEEFPDRLADLLR